MISAELYLGQHAKEAAPGELTEEIRYAAEGLSKAVNALLTEFLKATGLPRVLRSGWRPKGFNATFVHTDASAKTVRGGAPESKHCTGHGVDVGDSDAALDQWLDQFEDGKGGNSKLEQYSLYREHPNSTPSWCHLQDVAPHSGHRTFVP